MEFVIRARKAPTSPEQFLGQAGLDAHVEYLGQILINGLFISQSHRDDVQLTFVFESSTDFSRIIHFDGEKLGSLTDLSERGIKQLFANALKVSVGAAKGDTFDMMSGFTVTVDSFESLIKKYQTDRMIHLLDRKGDDIREIDLAEDAVFILTDHIPMPPKQAKSLVNRGARAISLGPKMLHASQCVVLIQNEYDRLPG